MLELPQIQNWSCNSCAGCCRQHQIEITEAERQRIEEQKWEESGEIPSGQPVIVASGPPWNRSHRLAHQPDGACVFLREDGLCRIHAKFGEEGKPLACRVYPYAFHPGSKGMTVSLRYSCPTVVADGGRPVKQQREELDRIARAIQARSKVTSEPPAVTPSATLDWKGYERIRDAFRNRLCDRDRPLILRLGEVLHAADALDECDLSSLDGKQVNELLPLLFADAEEAVRNWERPCDPVTKTGRMLFRVRVARYARKDTALAMGPGWRGRLHMMRAAYCFARGKRNVPTMQEGLAEVPFSSLDREAGFPPEAEELWSRYFKVKLDGNHICGPAFYDVSLTEGLSDLALLFASTMWIATWRAVSRVVDSGAALASESVERTLDDVRFALIACDHHHGYHPSFGSAGTRRQVRMLRQLGDVVRLCRHVVR